MNRIPDQRFKFFVFFIKRQKALFLMLLISCVFASLSISLWPFINGKVIDTLTQYSDDRMNIFTEMGSIFLFAIAFWVLMEFFVRIQGWVAATIYPQFEANIRMHTFQYVNNHSHNYFSNNYVGSIASRLSELPRSCSVIIDFTFNNFIPLLTSLIISSILFLRLDSTLSLILFGWLATHIGICALAGSHAANLSHDHSEARTQLQGKIVDTLNNHLNVKLYTKFLFEVENIKSAQNDEKSKNYRTLFFIEKFKLILSVIALVSIVSLLYISITFWQVNRISVGDLIFIFTTALSILSLAWTATVEMAYLFRELGVIKQALKIIRDPIDVTEQEDAPELNVNKGKIEFNKVTFKYRHNDNVFKEKTLTIEGGQKVGLVGLSGSGKTTFAHLILRLFNIESGAIRIDNQDISEVTLKSLRDNICMIPQEPMLFHRTIMDNIRYSSLDATDEDVIEASIRANCHEFIMNLENGYDTLVGERAAKLSGGQKQRISIARAILKDAPILIMDEATSALDSFTEKQIQESINFLSKGRTTIIIAHRLSTLLEVDRILVFDKGTIVEDGNHKELLAKDGHYAMLWKMQTAGLLPDSLDN